MSFLRSVLSNCSVLGDALVQPFRHAIDTCYTGTKTTINSYRDTQKALQLIPKILNNESLSYQEAAAFKIQSNGISLLNIFEGYRFHVTQCGSTVTVKMRQVEGKRPMYTVEQLASGKPLYTEALDNGVKTLSHITSLITRSDVLIPQAVAGATLKVAAIFTGCAHTATPAKVSESAAQDGSRAKSTSGPACSAGENSSMKIADANEKRTLTIRQISPEEFPVAAKVARSWQLMAYLKRMVAKVHGENEAASIFVDSSNISRLVAECFEDHDSCIPRVFERAIACYDAKDPDNIQAIALIKDDSDSLCLLDPHTTYLKIALMVTNPINIRSSVNSTEDDRVRGAGTNLIVHIAKECLEKKYNGLYLESVDSALPFYQKLGFEELDSEEVFMLEPLTIPMRLTIEQMNELLKKA